MACFGLKQGQDLENQVACPHHEFRAVPSGCSFLELTEPLFNIMFDLLINIHFIFLVTFPLDITKTRLQIQGERASTVSSTSVTNVPYRGMVRTAVGIGMGCTPVLSFMLFC